MIEETINVFEHMKVLSISTDRKLFEKESSVAGRMIEYARNIEGLHIIVFSLAYSGFEPISLGKNVWVYPTSSLNKLWYIIDAFRVGLRIGREHLLKRGNVLVTTQDPFECGFVGVLLKRRLHLPLQVQLHTDIGSEYFKRGLNCVRMILACCVFRNADTIRVVSNILEEKVRKIFHIPLSKIFILPVMSDKEGITQAPVTTDLKAKYPQFGTVVLMVGRLEPEKNYSFAFSVFSEVLKKHPGVGLIIVGKGSKEEGLKEYAHTLQIEKSILFEGDVSNVVSFYKTADIFLHTSMFEGYGLVFVEAALAGCPIVSSRVGLSSEFTATEAALCEVNDKSCFVSSLIELIENKEKRHLLSESAKKKINTLVPSKEEFLRKHQELWGKTASGRYA